MNTIAHAQRSPRCNHDPPNPPHPRVTAFTARIPVSATDRDPVSHGIQRRETLVIDIDSDFDRGVCILAILLASVMLAVSCWVMFV